MHEDIIDIRIPNDIAVLREVLVQFRLLKGATSGCRGVRSSEQPRGCLTR